jgi:hypothetical protein
MWLIESLASEKTIGANSTRKVRSGNRKISGQISSTLAWQRQNDFTDDAMPNA